MVSDCGGKAVAFSARGGKASALVTAVRNALVLALLLASCKQNDERHLQVAREAALRDTLTQMRAAIERFRADEKRPPASLNELVPQYLRTIPVDPITGVADWRLMTEETVAVSSDFTTAQAPKPTISLLDVKSKAPGVDASGKPYSEY